MLQVARAMLAMEPPPSPANARAPIWSRPPVPPGQYDVDGLGTLYWLCVFCDLPCEPVAPRTPGKNNFVCRHRGLWTGHGHRAHALCCAEASRRISEDARTKLRRTHRGDLHDAALVILFGIILAIIAAAVGVEILVRIFFGA